MSDVDGAHFVRARRKGRPTRWYVYAWRGGPQILASVGERRPKLKREHLDAIGAAIKDDTAPGPGTILSLVRMLRSSDTGKRPHSPEWESLAKGTQRVWGYELDKIETRWGKTPLSVWSDPRMVEKVVKWRDERKATPRPADMGIQVLRFLLEFARLRALVKLNVANDIPKLYRGGDRQEIVWTQDDIDAFTEHAIAEDREHLVDGLLLASVTGLRRDDLVTLTWAQVGEFAVVKKANKRSARKRRFATMPRIPELDAVLERLRARERQAGVDTVLVNSRGLPWTGDGFGGSFNRIRDLAGIAHIDGETGARRRKHLHDVRGTFVTLLCAETDLTNEEIAGIMAWSPEQVDTVRRIYVDQTRVVVAIGERIARGCVKPLVKRSGRDQ